jgi:hypothetical protein
MKRSKKTNFMLDAVASDFNVRYVNEDENGFRKGNKCQDRLSANFGLR